MDTGSNRSPQLIMSTRELFCRFTGINTSNFSKEEIFILELILFIRLYEELKEIFKAQHRNYFRLIKMNAEKENAMIEEKFIRHVINDILSTEEYTLPGIAYYTQTPEDVVYDVAIGSNTDPSSTLFRKIIKLHQSVRPELYREILKKITLECAELET